MVGWAEENTKRDPEAKEGMRIQMISMDDQHAIDRGMQGTIVRIDDLGTLHVKWDDGSTLGVIPEIDEYQLLPNEDNITTPDNFMNMFNENQSLSKNLSADWKKSSKKEKLNLKLESKGGDIKTDIKKILDTLKTSKPNQRSVIENMVKNLIVKYKNHKKDEKKFSDLIENLYTKISNKFDIDETTTAGSSGSYVANFSNNEIEETTTMSSVFNGNFPVTPYMFSKKGEHKPSKKPMFNGGKIVQKTDRFDILNELNKVKWVKGGKYVKIKDRCVKYNNKPWCSQGDLDKPLQLSDNTFENIKRVSKKTGLSEEQIIKKIKNYINIV
jgi:predicted CopG family antitoxin